MRILLIGFIFGIGSASLAQDTSYEVLLCGQAATVALIKGMGASEIKNPELRKEVIGAQLIVKAAIDKACEIAVSANKADAADVP